MNNVLNIYKPVGITPLELVNHFKQKFPKYKHTKIGYAGRLDPLAEGVMILLVHPETKKRNKYQNLKKEYVFKVLFGVSTDTYDILGKPSATSMRQRKVLDRYSHKNDILRDSVKKLLDDFIGKQLQTYPPYSSKTVKGKPLFWWARKNKLNDIVIPKKDIEIFDAKLIRLASITTTTLEKKVYTKIDLVQGDFRQDEIIKSWQKLFGRTKLKKFPVATIKISCSSGTYVRQISHQIGKKLKTKAVALEIKRTKVGRFKLNNSLKLG